MKRLIVTLCTILLLTIAVFYSFTYDINIAMVFFVITPLIISIMSPKNKILFSIIPITLFIAITGFRHFFNLIIAGELFRSEMHTKIYTGEFKRYFLLAITAITISSFIGLIGKSISNYLKQRSKI